MISEQYIKRNGEKISLKKFKSDIDEGCLLGLKVFQELENNGIVRQTDKNLIDCTLADFGIKYAAIYRDTYNFYFIRSDTL